MHDMNSSRRVALRQLASLSVLGAVGLLRSPGLLAAAGDTTPPPVPDGIRGRVVRRGDEDYEQWRQSMVWHLSKPDRRPDMIVQASSVEDVIATVKYAARQGLKIATRSGGHNSTGPSLRDGGICLSLSALNDVRIDPVQRIASIQPGTRSLQLVTMAREKGLCFPVPHCPTVGLGGFVMGGGIGWNYSHRGGVSCFSIRAAEVVTADGRLVRATPEHHPELLWAVRGAGPGFFGVVTRLELELYPVPGAILVSSYIHPLDELPRVTAALHELMGVKDSRVEVLALLMRNLEAPADAPREENQICFVSAFAFADTADEARTLLKPLAQSPLATGCLAKVENQPFSFEGLYGKFFSPSVPAGRVARYAVDNVMTDDTGETLLALAGHYRKAPAPDSHVLSAWGMNLKARDDACFSSIADSYVGCYAIWDDERDDPANFHWLGQAPALMDPYAKGHYVNEVEARLNPDRIRQCFSPENWRRLRALRRSYDPEGVFHDYLGRQAL